ncbi:MAG: mechanosensitive ion channel family protein [Woeseiaceae bacterium]
MQDFIEQTQAWVQLLGPNVYLQAAAIAAIFVIIGKIADLVISRLIAKLVSRSQTDLDDNFVAILHRTVFISFVLLGLALATDRLQMLDAPEYLTLGIIKTIAIVTWYNCFRGLVQILIVAAARSSGASKFPDSMLPLVNNVLKVALFALAVYFFFLAWNIDVTAWLASAGIVGLALSFAAKDTLSNLFAGVSIVADAPYKTGDFITLDTGERGMVTHIGLRSTRILTRDDIEITVPNGIIGNTKIVNEAGGPSAKHRIRIPIGVAYGSDVDTVIATLEAVAAEHAEVCKAPAPRVRFRRFGDSSLEFEMLCWIDLPVNRGRMIHELNCAVYKSFQKIGIEIPFPQRDLHVRSMPTPVE